MFVGLIFPYLHCKPVQTTRKGGPRNLVCTAGQCKQTEIVQKFGRLGCNYQFALRASANDPKRSQSFQIANFSNLSTPFALQASANWPKTCKCLWDWFSRVCTASQCKQPKKVDLVTPAAIQQPSDDRRTFADLKPPIGLGGMREA